MHLDPEFAPYTETLDLETMDRSEDVAYFLDTSFVLRGYNDSWIEFALANDGADVIERFPIGCDVLAVIDESLRPFYVEGYRKAMADGERFDCEYECSSPDVFRLLAQSAYPLDTAGWLITNHFRIQEPFAPDAGEELGPRHVDETGNIIQCCHCRKTRDQSRHEKWDWIPQLVRNPRPEITHSLCVHCLNFYYPAQA
jgi:hypothetical protein